jgi:hypothetical protein
MTVETGGVEPAKGHWRILWWLAAVFGLVCVALALVTGRPGIAGGAFLLVFPLQRLFWNTPGTDPSKAGWQRTRERFGSDSEADPRRG